MTPVEDVNESCIVRVYQRTSENPQALTGVVEQVDTGARKGFHNKEELWAILIEYCAGISKAKPSKRTQ